MKRTNRRLHGMIIVTYRCNAHCNMCFQHLHVKEAAAKKQEELSLDTVKKLPDMAFCNITGGEPFLRTDLKEIIEVINTKADRIVIVTNGYFTDRILDMCKSYPNIGIRISMEGLQETNDAIRGIPNGFEKGISTLRKLHEMGYKDVGFSTTVQDKNCNDLIPLYELGDELDFEHATSTLHNSFYFKKFDNEIENKYKVGKSFEALVNKMLHSKSPKKWFRAYFNHGLINYIYNQPRLLPCEMSSDAFFIEPYGDVIPCNGMVKKAVMGNLNNQSWDELWTSQKADEVRKQVKSCNRGCWMIGSVAPAMEKRIWIPVWWIIKHKLFMKNRYCLNENKFITIPEKAE
jgi:Fe-coproporphyrin III synthase